MRLPPVNRMTLCYLIDPDRETVKLGEKRRKIGAGKLNGPGGRQKRDEDLAQTNLREVFAETGVTPVDPYLMGRIQFQVRGGARIKEINDVWIYVATGYRGRLRPSPELGILKDYSIRALPLDRLMVADRLWLKRMLMGEHVEGCIDHSEDTVHTYDLVFTKPI